MKYLRWVTRLVRAAFYASVDRWRLQQFIWMSRLLGMEVTVGSGTDVQVPLRGEGAGSLRIGSDNLFGYRMAMMLGSGSILLQPRSKNAVIRIGNGNLFNNNVALVANDSLTIGNNCQIGDLVAIYDCDFHEINPDTRTRSSGKTMPVTIGNNVWLGSRVIVLKGVAIGDNSVVGANSLVTKSIPANCIAAGSPAKVIRSIAR